MGNIDAGSTNQHHEEEDSNYHPPDGGESSVFDVRNCVMKSVPTMQGTILPAIEGNITILGMGQMS
eukprot:8396803-Ditylum_brightwellii.AAC.1